MTFDHSIRTRHRRPCATTPSLAALAAVLSAPALAQEASPPAAVVAQAQVAEQLPPIVVQGATIAPPKPASKPVEAEPVAAAPAPKPKAKSKAAAKAQKSAPGGGATPTGAEVTEAAGGGGAAASAGAPDSRPIADAEGLPLERVGTAVTVVTGAELRAQQVRHAADALRSLPGVSVSRQGGPGGFTQVRIRGAEANHTLVLIDGVRANDATIGEFDFSDLSAEDIERIEVLRGPQSGLYGAGALGGVINIVTAKGRGPLTVSARVEGGSFGTTDVAGRVSAGTDRAWFSFGYHRRETDGFNVSPFGSEEDGSRLSTLSLSAGVEVMPGLTVDFSLRKSESVGDYDDFGGNPGPFATAADALNVFDHGVLLASVGAQWELLDGAFVQSLRLSHNSTDRTDASPFTSSQNDSTMERLRYTATYRFDTPALLGTRHYVTGLVEHEREGFTPSSDFGSGFAADGIERRRALLGTAVEYRAEIADRLFLSGVVRRDDHDTFDDYTTWRATSSLRLPELAMRPHASVGTAVKLPTMFETFGSIPAFFAPNPDLAPERSFGWDAGIEFMLFGPRATVDVTYFNADLEDKIDGFAFDPVSGLFTAVNLPGTSTREGVEVAGRFALMPGLSLGLAYTYTDARRPDDAREIRRAPHAARGDVTYVFDQGRGTVRLGAVYNGQMQDTARLQPSFAPVTLDLDDYWLIDVAASYKVLPGIEVYGRVENLFDQDYQEIFGYETAGVAAYVGVRLTYEDPSTRDWAKYK